MPSRPKLEGLASAFGIAPEQLLPEGYFPDVHFKKATKSENFSHQKPPSTEFTLSVIEGSELVWLRVNKQVPVAIGLKIGAMLLCAGQNVEEL